MDKVQTIIAFIISLITFGTIIYKLLLKNTHKREDEYYDNVLKPFIVKYEKNKDINAVKYIREQVSREQDYVPKYIFFLLDDSKKEELKKVLIMDYLDLYNNDSNNIVRGSNYLQKVLLFVGMILSLIFLSVGIGLIVLYTLSLMLTLIYEIVQNEINAFKNIDWIMYIDGEIVGGICSIIGFCIIKLHLKLNIDRYSIKKSRIDKIIYKKVSDYDKHSDKYVV